MVNDGGGCTATYSTTYALTLGEEEEEEEGLLCHWALQLAVQVYTSRDPQSMSSSPWLSKNVCEPPTSDEPKTILLELSPPLPPEPPPVPTGASTRPALFFSFQAKVAAAAADDETVVFLSTRR